MKFYFRGGLTPQKATTDKYCYPSYRHETKQSCDTLQYKKSTTKPSQNLISPPCPHAKKHPQKKKKIDFKCLKKDTINSLNEVENFLCNFQNIYKYIKLYNILK